MKDLDGVKAIKMYREMSDNEPVVGTFLLLVDLLMRQTPWTVTPSEANKNNPEALQVAKFIESCVDDVAGGMGGFKSAVVTSLIFGTAVIEKVHKIRRGKHPLKQLQSKHDDGRIGLRELALRPMESLERWEFDADGDATQMVQRPPAPDTTLRYIDLKRCCHVIPITRKKSPQGWSLLRLPYISYFHLKNIRFIEAVGVERDLAGYPVMQVPPGMIVSQHPDDVAAMDSYREMTKLVKRDEYEGLVVPCEEDERGKTGFKFGLMGSGGRRPTDVDAIIRRYESRIAIALLSEFILLGMDKHGSFAMADAKTDTFALAVKAILDIVDEQWNTNIIPELIELNGIDPALTPWLAHGDMEKVDSQTFSSSLATLINAGAIVTDDGIEDKAREVIGAPPREKTAMMAPASITQTANEDAQQTAEPENVAATAFNGAQVSSLKEILIAVAAGEVPKESARALIMIAFRTTAAEAEALIGPIQPGSAANTNAEPPAKTEPLPVVNAL